MFARITLAASAALAGSLLASAAACAADVKPAVLYDLGGKFDKSFNEGVFNGATRFTKETGIKFRDLELQNEAQREQDLREFAKRGFSPIMTVGFAWETALKKVAPEYPQDRLQHHRRRGRPAERPVDRVQGAGRLIRRRRDRGEDDQDRQGRLRRRHGHSADLEIRMRICAGRQIRVRRQRRSVRQHDRHDARGVERSGQGRRTRQVADRPGSRHRLRRRGRDRAGRAEGGGRRRQVRHRRRFRTRTVFSRGMCSPRC